MNVILALLRRHLLETRWMLGISAAAFLAVGYLTSWLAVLFERSIDSGDMERLPRGAGIFRGLGGAAQDFSTTGLEVCFWNHPMVILTLLAWAVSRGSAAGAGEIERGTIDVTLSRPVSRSTYLTSQVLFTVLGLIALAACLITGTTIGGLVYSLKSPPSPTLLLQPATMLVTLGMAVFGYTLPFSSFDVVRWRPTLASATITLAGLIAMSVAPLYEAYENLLKRLSVFQAYAPVTVALQGEPLAYNATVLLLVFALGLIVSYVVFLRRDIPSNS
jgi:ABC-2 type transport system permease protein